MQRRGTMYDPLIVDTFAAVKEAWILRSARPILDSKLAMSLATPKEYSRFQSFDVRSMTISFVLDKPS